MTFQSIQFMLATAICLIYSNIVTFLLLSFKHLNLKFSFSNSADKNISSEIGFYDSCYVACPLRIIVTIKWYVMKTVWVIK